MKEHTYQLNVELQFNSTDEDARSIEANWHAALSDWLDRAKEPALVSAIKCARTHKFDEAHFSRDDAHCQSMEATDAINEVATLIKRGADGGFGEFDGPCDELVRAKWPNVTDWECGQVTYSEGVVTLHDLYVVE